MENFYLHYTGSDALAEAQAACDLCHALASRSVEDGGIEGYAAEKYADPIKHPDRNEWLVPFDVDRAALVDVPADIQTRLDNRAKLSIAESEGAGFFPVPDYDPEGEPDLGDNP